MISTVTDSPPQIRLSEITCEPSATTLANEYSRRVTLFEAELLDDIYNPNIDILR